MINRILRVSILFTALVIFISGIITSCNKGSATPVPLPIPAVVDTTRILTSHQWNLSQIWKDMNNNQHIDSGEMIPGFVFSTIYIIYANGWVKDSTYFSLSRTGSWYYKDNYHSSIYFKWSASDVQLHTIQLLNDSMLNTRRITTDETWYFTAN